MILLLFSLLLPAAVLIALDQALKYWAAQHLQPVGVKPFIDGFMRFAYVENPGAALGILEGWRWFFIPLTVVIVTGLIIYYFKLPRTRKNLFVRVPIVFIIAGAVGNLIDRIKNENGYVVDMLDFQFIDFYVFNLADAMLVCGAAALVLATLFSAREKE